MIKKNRVSKIMFQILFAAIILTMSFSYAFAQDYSVEFKGSDYYAGMVCNAEGKKGDKEVKYGKYSEILYYLANKVYEDDQNDNSITAAVRELTEILPEVTYGVDYERIIKKYDSRIKECDGFRIVRLDDIQKLFNELNGFEYDLHNSAGSIYSYFVIIDGEYLLFLEEYDYIPNTAPCFEGEYGDYEVVFKNGSEVVDREEYNEISEYLGEYAEFEYSNCRQWDLNKIVHGVSENDAYIFFDETLNNRKALVNVDGEMVEFDTDGKVINDRMHVPMRAIAEKLGYNVDWEEEERNAYVRDKNGNLKIIFFVDFPVINKDNMRMPIDSIPIIYNGRILLPVRVLSEALGFNVEWIENNGSINISSVDDMIEEVYNQELILENFLYSEFEEQTLTMQGEAYIDIENDNNYVSDNQRILSFEFIDMDKDGQKELIISSKSDSDEYMPNCFSVWDCDDDGNVNCILAKCGQMSRAAYRYFIMECNGEIYLIETMGESNSAGRISVRNKYIYTEGNIKNIEKIYYRESFDLSGDEQFTINDEYYSKDYVKNKIDEIDKYKILFSQFN